LIAAVLNFKRLTAVFLTIFRVFGVHIGIIGALIRALFARFSNQTPINRGQTSSYAQRMGIHNDDLRSPKAGFSTSPCAGMTNPFADNPD
jgi:hypothetical protein